MKSKLRNMCVIASAVVSAVAAFAGYQGYYPSCGESYGLYANYYEGGSPGWEWTVFGTDYQADASSNDLNQIQAWSDAAADAGRAAAYHQYDIEYCISNGKSSKSAICTYP